MVELLTSYSLTEILVFLVLLGVAFKSVSTFIDWLRAKRNTDALKDMKPEKLEKAIQDEVAERKKQIQEMEEHHKKDVTEIKIQISDVATQMSNLTGKIDLLVESDKDDIKAFITREYHFFCDQQGWIDDYSMDCIEKRYMHYIAERGNSFVEQLMDALRALPRQKNK